MQRASCDGSRSQSAEPPEFGDVYPVSSGVSRGGCQTRRSLMRRVTVVALFLLAFLLGPALALQGKSASAPGQVKKKAHADITRWLKAKKRKMKTEIRIYDDLIRWGVPAKEALQVVKTVVDNNLELGSLGHFLRRRADKGIRGKVLSEAIRREVKARAEKKKKEKEAKRKKVGKTEGKAKGKKGKKGK